MPNDWFPLWLSLRVAALSTLAAFVIGLAIAYFLANVQFRGRFFQSDETCDVSYADKKGKSQKQQGLTLPRL